MTPDAECARPVAEAECWADESILALVQKAAYEHFEWRGRQPGRELDDWLQAEHEIKLQLKYIESNSYECSSCAT